MCPDRLPARPHAIEVGVYWLTALGAVCLLAGCLSPTKKIAERLPDLREQWQASVIRQIAQPQRVVDWPMALALLQENNPKLRRARLEITNSQELVRQVFKDLLPTVNL